MRGVAVAAGGGEVRPPPSVSDFTSSPIPATVPVMPAKSAGTMIIFELGLAASAPNASTYYCATK